MKATHAKDGTISILEVSMKDISIIRVALTERGKVIGDDNENSNRKVVEDFFNNI